MTIVVALPRDERGTAALHLANMLARSAADDLVVCTVIPASWPAGMARIDAEYQEYLDRVAQETLDLARRFLPADLSATFVAARARSAASGVLEIAGQHGAGLIVVGSSEAGAWGRVTVGSVAERLLHSSPVPVAVAPRGFRGRPDSAVARVTAAFGATAGSDDVVLFAARIAARMRAELRVASFAVRPGTILTAGVGPRAEDEVVAEWVREVEKAQRDALRRLADLPAPQARVETVVGSGHGWPEAFDDVGWRDGDILVVGSSTVGPVATVFLGSRASKIVRLSPVPVLVVPRGGPPP